MAKMSSRILLAKLAKLEKKRSQLKMALMRISAKHRHFAQAARSALKREAKERAKAKRGRPSRWPGLCVACMMRHHNEPGGPTHDIKLCKKTQRKLKNTNR